VVLLELRRPALSDPQHVLRSALHEGHQKQNYIQAPPRPAHRVLPNARRPSSLVRPLHVAWPLHYDFLAYVSSNFRIAHLVLTDLLPLGSRALTKEEESGQEGWLADTEIL